MRTGSRGPEITAWCPAWRGFDSLNSEEGIRVTTPLGPSFSSAKWRLQAFFLPPLSFLTSHGRR